MPLIITATDFSEIANNAVNYACSFASAHSAQVVIIHSFMIPVMFSDIPTPGTLITDTQNDADEKMEQFVGKTKVLFPGLNIEGIVLYGDTVDALNDFTEENGAPLLVVIGNNSNADNPHWPDSTLMNVFKDLAYPVLAIPTGFRFRPVANICFAFDNNFKGTSVALTQIKEMAAMQQAALHVLSIIPSGHDADKLQHIDQNAQLILSPVTPQYHVISGSDNVDRDIQQFLSAGNIDWLVMIPRKHSFFEGLFHKSHTKAIAHHSTIPVLALHEDRS